MFIIQIFSDFSYSGTNSPFITKEMKHDYNQKTGGICDLPLKLSNNLPLKLTILGNLKTSYNYILPIAQLVPLPKQKFCKY